MTDSRRYKAFISYSHSDERWARWLQRSLEKYRLPKALLDKHPELPKRLFPVFRDRDELASGGDLSDSIRQAMDDSEALIVICSPAARTSRWVNEEIKRFRASDRGHRIFCLLVDGSPEPDAPNCAFPTALLLGDDGEILHEPLAADATPKGDGKRNAMLKIAAGLLHVGVDELKRRDAQRQARFWSFVAAGSLLIASLTIGLAIYAFNAKKESEIRRQQAEGLIGFMLGDLRKKLEPIGKLELLDSVGDQAMNYFATLGDRGTPKEMLARAVALKQIGDVRFNQGKLEPALKAFEQALAQARALYNADASNNDNLFELGQAEFWVGYVAWERGDLEHAESTFKNYMQYSRELLRREPANSDYSIELSYAYSNLGSVAHARGNLTTALENFILSRDINALELKKNPGDIDLTISLAEAWSWIGTTKQDLGDLQGSEQAFSQVIELLLPQLETGQNVLAANVVGKNLIFLADVKMNQGERLAAERFAAQSVELLNRLSAQDPENAVWKTSTIKAELIQLSFIPFQEWSSKHDMQAAAALVTLETLEQQSQGNNAITQHAAYTLRLQALRALHSGDTAKARKLAESSYSAITGAVSDNKDTANSLRIYGMVAETFGTTLAAAGETDKAKIIWQRAADTFDQQPLGIFDFKPIRRLLAINLEQPDIEQRLSLELSQSSYKNPRLQPPFTLSGTFRQ